MKCGSQFLSKFFIARRELISPPHLGGFSHRDRSNPRRLDRRWRSKVAPRFPIDLSFCLLQITAPANILNEERREHSVNPACYRQSRHLAPDSNEAPPGISPLATVPAGNRFFSLHTPNSTVAEEYGGRCRDTVRTTGSRTIRQASHRGAPPTGVGASKRWLAHSTHRQLAARLRTSRLQSQVFLVAFLL